MKLSVIIVNYNVRYFLDQALGSVLQSDCDFSYEVIVVDNGSTDDSVPWVKANYPGVKLLSPGENLGFAKANNLAVNSCKGEYVLLLNPDTIVQKETLQQCIDFMENHHDAGALGVRMFDGSGVFLPESKRGFPGPWTSFCKITGLNELFPRSKWLNYYYMGHLNSNENQVVDVLTGAFMMMKKVNYQSVGGLDEEFFMYGEDIDLCYQLSQKGFKNYYLASTSIIHFKGESTKKSSLKYIRTFYSAMSIYAKKHYSSPWQSVLSVLIQLAIYTRAWMAVLSRFIRQIHFLIIDIVSIVVVFGILSTNTQYSPPSGLAVLITALCYSTLLDFFAGKRPSFRWWPITQSFIISLVFSSVLFLFHLMDEKNYLYIGLSVFFVSIIKIMYAVFSGREMMLPQNKRSGNTYVLSDRSGFKAAAALLDLSKLIPEECIQITDLNHQAFNSESEIVFDPRVIRWDQVVRSITAYPGIRAIRILALDRKALISSSSKNQVAEVIHLDRKIDDVQLNLMEKKRKGDVLISLVLLFLSPILLLLGKGRRITQAWQVLRNEKTWIGVEPSLHYLTADLSEDSVWRWKEDSALHTLIQQELYIRNYRLQKDLMFIIKSL